ncbi:hypothetical protein DS745_03145 [Anaerobacillus alkaliphilus]|uniref:Uncharacterized protein n=1 Tax=Anaerobacillus alkaliphilus TaxID=1548597 RepID=A0A4V1LGY9_9BACI|nr:hypothetical protein [Anaerobacillus alkaliphilus]RXJ04395.1 hypothetical protein DS745_03145 [Anaerobacillus alkaliphilus]
MKIEKKFLFSIIIITTFFVYWGITYYQNSTVEKLLRNVKGNILEVIPVNHNERIVLVDSRNFIEAISYKKGVFGWNNYGSSSPAIRPSISEEDFRIDFISSIAVSDRGIYYGYAPDSVTMVRLQTNDFDIRYKVHSYYWYIPLDQRNFNFKAEQFSVFYNDGREGFYPFNRP